MVSGKVSGKGGGKGGKSVMDLARRAGMLEAYRGGFHLRFSMYSRLYIDFTADMQSRSSRHSHSQRHRDEKHSAVCVSAQLVQRTCILASTFSFRQICIAC